jgi:hypothetical protein
LRWLAQVLREGWQESSATPQPASKQETEMKTMLTASLLALASHVAVAGPLYAGTTHSSPSTLGQSHQVRDGLGYGGPVRGPQEPVLTSLEQFEQGDPDAMVTVGYMASAQHHGPTGSALTSLGQFERGDPDTTPGG